MSSAAEHAGAGSGLTPGARAHVAVTATTLWVEPDTARPGVDDPSLTNPVDLDAGSRSPTCSRSRRRGRRGS